jgi:hypothetical protein
MKKLLILLLFELNINCKIVTEKHNYELIEEINGKKFTLMENNLNGAWSFDYQVDEKNVDKTEFEKLKIKAKKQEWLLKERCKEEARKKSVENSNFLRVKLNKKILESELDSCKSRVNKVQKGKLGGYFIYSAETFSSEGEWQKFVDFVIPELEKIVQSSDSDLDIAKLERFVEKLEPYESRIDQFVVNAINNAIEKCDDTKKLKKIIELLE